MPLVALAVLGFGAGLVAGLTGALAAAAAAVGSVGLLAVVRRSAALGGFALVAGAGVLLGRATERSDHACATRAAGLRSFSAVFVEDAAPGGFSEARLDFGRCTLDGRVAIASGRAAAGAPASVRGRVTLGARGVVVASAEVVARGRPASLASMRAASSRSIEKAFGADAPLAKALLIADTRDLSPEIRERYAAAGLVHMLSISGMHVAIIAAAVLLVFRAARLPVRGALLATVAVTGAYVAMIGAPAPAVRAAVMLGVTALSRVAQRPTSPWASLALGAAVPLADPRVALDLGYQLSVVGMVSLIASAALDRRVLRPRLHGWRHAVAASLLTSVVASVVTGPLVAWRFGRASLIAPVANLVAAPLMAFAQPTLFLTLLLSPWPSAARFLAGAVHPILWAFDAVATWAALVPGASVTVSATTVALVVSAIATVCAVAACVRADPWPPGLLGGAALVVLLWLPAISSHEGAVELHMLDVGQGDALALRTPNGRWIVFDAGRIWRGGDAGRTVVVPYLRARGGSVAAFVLSHPHADHVGGAATVVRTLRPGVFIDPGFAAGGDAYREALGAARSLGVRWQRVHPGDSLDIDGVVLRLLAPDSTWAASLRDANLASAIVLVRYGRTRMLLVGDAEAEEESWLLSRSGKDALRADVLKVGHHGSRTSSTAPFLAEVRPRLALVSVGAGNGYGHPNAEVIGALAAAGAQVLRTDRHGTVIVRSDGMALSVQSGGRTWDLPPR